MSRKKKVLTHHIKHHAHRSAKGALKGLHTLARAGLLTMGLAFALLFVSGLTIGYKYKKLYNKVDGKVFQVINQNSTGTGFQVRNPNTGKVFFMTNNHICADTDGKTVYADVKGQLVPLKILLTSLPNDMCIATPISGVEPLEINLNSIDKEALYMVDGFGYGVKDIGFGKIIRKMTQQYPLAPIVRTPEEASHWMSMGVTPMTAKDCVGDGFSQKVFNTEMFGPVLSCIVTQTSLFSTVKVYPGNSGSPIVDLDGRVVSLVWGGFPETHYSMSTPIAKFVELSNNL